MEDALWMDEGRSVDDIEPGAEAASVDVKGREPPAASRLGVSGTQVCASTLASVSAAVVASVFGVTGTVIGAAVGSVIATTGSALYDHGIRRTGAKLQQMPAAGLIRPVTALKERDGWKDWLSKRHWGLAVGVAIVFVASLVTVTFIELVGQQPLASISGNDPSGSTSIGSLFDDGGKDGPDDTTPTTVPGETDEGPTSTAPDDSSEEPDPSTTSPEATEPETEEPAVSP